MEYKELEKLALDTGFSYAAELDASTLELRQEVRDMCGANTCGMYGRNLACPPACGTLEECRKQVEEYGHGIIVQTVGDVEDSMDFARVSERLVPAMALLYLGSGALVLLVRAEELPQAFSLIFSCALNPEAALGGGGGYALSAALRHGVARGVFTNEAGLGTSAMAHGAARVDHPAKQGMWGIFEVFVSTLLVCTVTALVILVSGVYVPEEALSQLQSGQVPGSSLGVPLTARAFASVLGPAGEWVVALSLILFAFSSILGWSCYGQQGLRYLTGGDRFLPLYRAVFLGCIVLGAVSDVSPLWQLVDLCNALMALPNLTALLLLSPQALGCLRAWAKTQK